MQFTVTSKGKDYTVLIDAADWEKVGQYNWYMQNERGYLRARKDGRTVALHRLLLDAPQGLCVDHINGDPLDNRRQNLRLCTHSENMRNRRIRSGQSKGVTWRERDGKWEASIKVDGVNYFLGQYHDKAEAVRTYDAIARHYHGRFARTNHPGTETMTLEGIRLSRAARVNHKTSRYIGVAKDKGRWRALVQQGGRKLWSKYGDDPKALAKERDKQALVLLGSAAVLNFPIEDSTP